MDVKFDMTTRQKAIFGCLQVAHTQDYLNTIPINGLGQHMWPLIPLFLVDEVCSVCRKTCLDIFGEHTIHYRKFIGFKCRYNPVGDVMFNIFRWAEVSVKKETPVNILYDPYDGRSTLMPTYVLVYELVGKKHICVGLTRDSPLLWLRTKSFIMSQSTLKVVSSKVVKHEEACSDNQLAFIPFVFDTFGFPAPEVVDLLQESKDL